MTLDYDMECYCSDSDMVLRSSCPYTHHSTRPRVPGKMRVSIRKEGSRSPNILILPKPPQTISSISGTFDVPFDILIIGSNVTISCDIRCLTDDIIIVKKHKNCTPKRAIFTKSENGKTVLFEIVERDLRRSPVMVIFAVKTNSIRGIRYMGAILLHSRYSAKRIPREYRICEGTVNEYDI